MINRRTEPFTLNLHTLASLALHHRRISLAAEGGISIVLGAMGRFSGNVAVQRAGCNAVYNLATRNLKNKIALAERGAVGAVASALERFPKSLEVQEAGCGAFWALSGAMFIQTVFISYIHCGPLRCELSEP